MLIHVLVVGFLPGNSIRPGDGSKKYPGANEQVPAYMSEALALVPPFLINLGILILGLVLW
jgi:hypothetical protein